MAGWLSGKVQWFDTTTGEGMVVDPQGNPFYVHWSTIKPTDKSTTKRRNLTEGKRVRFKIFGPPQRSQVEVVEEV